MAAYGLESLFAALPVLEDIDRRLALFAQAKAFYGLVPDGLARQKV